MGSRTKGFKPKQPALPERLFDPAAMRWPTKPQREIANRVLSYEDVEREVDLRTELLVQLSTGRRLVTEQERTQLVLDFQNVREIAVTMVRAEASRAMPHLHPKAHAEWVADDSMTVEDAAVRSERYHEADEKAREAAAAQLDEAEGVAPADGPQLVEDS